MKDIKVVNLRELGRNLEPYAIVCSGLSTRHCYSTAKTLVKKLKELECAELKTYPTIAGCKDDPWLAITVKQVVVHILIDSYRYDLDLEFRWLNPLPLSMKKKMNMYAKLRKKSDNMEINDDTFDIKDEEEADIYRHHTEIK